MRRMDSGERGLALAVAMAAALVAAPAGAVGTADAADGPASRAPSTVATCPHVAAAGAADEPPQARPGSESGGLATVDVAALADFAAAARVQAGLPGAAIAVVQDGRIVLARGLGVRDLRGDAPVTPRTRFLVGSVTKPLTTLLIARLVDEGVLAWDTPLADLLPGFRLGDAATSRSLTVADAACNCTPLRGPDDVWGALAHGAAQSPEAQISTLAANAATGVPGTAHCYRNTLVAAAGYAAAHAAHPELPLAAAYRTAMAERVLGPLGAAGANFAAAGAGRDEDATGHGWTLDAPFVPLDPGAEDWTVPLAPAGGLWASVEAMAHLVAAEVDLGLGLDGVRVASAAQVAARYRPRSHPGADTGYGLGIVVDAPDGLTRRWHNGGTTGFYSLYVAYPDLRLGLVLLTNGAPDGPAAAWATAVEARLRERVLRRDLGAAAALGPALAKMAAAAAYFGALATPTFPPDMQRQLCGTYAHPTLGTLTLAAQGDRLTATLGRVQCRLIRERSGSAAAACGGPSMRGFVLQPVPGDRTPSPAVEFTMESDGTTAAERRTFVRLSD